MSYTGNRRSAQFTYGAGQFFEQVYRGQLVMSKYHELLVEAGAVWDGMDGYDVTTLPEGRTNELWIEACGAMGGAAGAAVPGAAGQRAGSAEG